MTFISYNSVHIKYLFFFLNIQKVGPDIYARHSSDLVLFNLTHNASIRLHQPLVIGMHGSGIDHSRLPPQLSRDLPNIPINSATLAFRAISMRVYYYQRVVFNLLMTNVENDDDYCKVCKCSITKTHLNKNVSHFRQASLCLHFEAWKWLWSGYRLNKKYAALLIFEFILLR